MGRRIKYHTEEQRKAARRQQSAERRSDPGCVIITEIVQES